MKRTLQEEKQRICQIINMINEQAFNDNGEPLMTHNQYRDYSEPSEPDDMINNGEEYTVNNLIDELENHFNTKLQKIDDEYYILTSTDMNDDDDMMIWVNGNSIGAVRIDGQKFDERNIEDIDPYELIKFFSPYQGRILNRDEAIKQIDDDYNNYVNDLNYDRQERAFTGGE